MNLKEQAAIVLIFGLVLAYYITTGPSKKESIPRDHLDSEYDFIIVGGGSAGSVIASRLSEDKDRKVLLLEAGCHWNENPSFHIPMRQFNLLNTEYDWGYYTVPQKVSCLGMKEKQSFWPRGRILGGTSILNAMQYTRGSKYDYNEWAANGCKGWSYKDVLPYFLKSEDMQIDELKSSKYHSTGGRLAVSGGRITPLSDLYMRAGEDLGWKVSDYNGADQEGFSRIQVTARNGVRSSTGVEFLGDTADRDNLHISLRSHVTKVNIEDKRATGVYFIRNGRKHFIKAKKEVIMSAGAIGSPHLLMLSGVGPKNHLTELGIEVNADLPVGHNLQDHLMIFMFTRINSSISITSNVQESLLSKIKYHLFGTGPLSICGTEGTAFLRINKSGQRKTYPDIQFMLASILFNKNVFNLDDEVAEEYLTSEPNEDGFTTLISTTHPKSVGNIKLRSTDPFDYPIIDPQYLTDKRDIDDFIAGVREWEKFMDTPTIKKLGVDIDQSKMSFCSNYEFRSDAYWECYVRHLAVTDFHPSCTCKMGAENDPTAVVDPELRVKGIKGLRVVDASIFPNLISGNLNAPVIMAAEKAADLIRGVNSVKNFRENLPNDV